MITQVSESFVPVAVNLYKIREDQGPAGELFRGAQRQKDQYQGIWILRPTGEVLAAHQEFTDASTWTSEVLHTIESAKTAFGAITRRKAEPTNPLPSRGKGYNANGSATLAVYARQMAGGGKQRVPQCAPWAAVTWIWDGELRADGPAVIDSLTLSGEEWGSFSPPELSVGSAWSIPEGTAKKLSRVGFPSSDQSLMPREEDCFVAKLNAQIESFEQDVAVIRLTGEWETRHIYDDKPSFTWSSGEGYATVDLKTKKIRSLLIVFASSFRAPPPYDKEYGEAGGEIEWVAASD